MERTRGGAIGAQDVPRRLPEVRPQPKEDPMSSSCEAREVVGLQWTTPVPDPETDAFIASNGFKLSVSVCGEYLGTFVEDANANKALKEWCDANKYWPTVWDVSDHGDYEVRMDDEWRYPETDEAEVTE